MQTISKIMARKIYLNAQALVSDLQKPAEVFEHLGYVQVDSINVVERAHHHVLWTRCPNYKPEHLVTLMHKRKVFEYWYHAAAILPMRDYRYSLLTKRHFCQRNEDWYPVSKNIMHDVRRRIEVEGPMSSMDFDHVKKGKHGWWEWKPAKRALEKMFLRGELEITARRGFQKVFDVPERCIPGWQTMKEPTEEEYAWYLIKNNLRHHGLSKLEEISYLRKASIKKSIKNELQNRLENNDLLEIKVQGVRGQYFCFPDVLEKTWKTRSKVHLLSPFDNAVIQRQKLRNLFDFDYQIECYLPHSKRTFGYFSLPVLMGHKFIGRLDAKAHRKDSLLEIKSFHCEKKEKKNEVKKLLESKLEKFAEFNACNVVKWA